MKCVIMQPTYLPWAGFFNLIAQADYFVFLDDVQYEKCSWQNRNRILLNGKEHWLTVPGMRVCLSQLFKIIEVDDKQKWRKTHYQTLAQGYAKHPYAKDVLDTGKTILDTSIKHLAELNISLITKFSEGLGLSPKMVRSSQLDIEGSRSERLIKICQYFNCNEYLSPLGSRDYLEKDGLFRDSPIRLLFQQYEPTPYPQLGAKEFVSHLSIVDVLANLGWANTAQYVKGGPVVVSQVM